EVWPQGGNNKLTPHEAKRAARRLYRHFTKRRYPHPIKIKTRGASYLWRHKPAELNPGRGWRHFVHEIGHDIHGVMYPGHAFHGPSHAEVESDCIRYVLASGWLDGNLRAPEKPAPTAADKSAARHARILARITAWESKAKRAENALKKLRRQRAYYE